VHTTCSGHRRTGRVGSGRRARLDRHLLDRRGTYGDPSAGDPIQYDELRIERDQGAVEIVVYNRAIRLFTTDNEVVVRRRRRLTRGTPRLSSAPVASARGQGNNSGSI